MICMIIYTDILLHDQSFKEHSVWLLFTGTASTSAAIKISMWVNSEA
jgi:hypothetical protein